MGLFHSCDEDPVINIRVICYVCDGGYYRVHCVYQMIRRQLPDVFSSTLITHFAWFYPRRNSHVF
jgi:hypothetical protein